MQLLKSLFCLQGFDNRIRFFSICSAIYFIFILLASAFTGEVIFSSLLCIIFSVALGLTSLRRLHDSKLNKNWLFASSLSFALASLFITFSQQHSSYYLLIIPILSSAVLLTYPSKKQSPGTDYILGYIGPVDMSEYQQSSHQGKSAKFRIEPRLAGGSAMNIDAQEQDFQHTHSTYAFDNNQQSSTLNNNKADIGELIRLKLLNHKKTQLAIMSTVVISLVIILVSWVTSLFNDNNAGEVEQPIVAITPSANTEIVREHPLAMPDNFTLFLSQHQGLIINWQADEVATPQLWSQFTAQGDESCQQISFNKGKPIRSLTVNVENIGEGYTDYYASFSPMDSQTLVQALAFRGKFSLCGYEFSLKGSQASLGKNKHYAHWANY